MARIYEKDLEEMVESINATLEDKGVNLVLNYCPRNGYAGVDYKKDGGGKNTLLCGISNRVCFDTLNAIKDVIHLVL